MNAAPDGLLFRVLGWYLWESLWFGVAVAMGYALFERAAAHLDPRVRYAAACASLVSILLVPAILAAWRVRSGGAIVPLGEYWTEESPSGGLPSQAWVAGSQVVRTTQLAVWRGWVADAAPFAIGLWVAGVAAMAGRYCLVWAAVRRLSYADVAEPPAAFSSVLEKLRLRMGIRSPIRMLISNRVEVPMVFGWFRIVILIPASLALGMPAEMLEAILAHELAHVRRHDWLVNLVQVFASTVLFHHPAVWWLGGRISAEREYCCDDMAVRASGGKVPYLRALVRLEELRSGPSPELALGASGGDLLARARRLAGEAPTWSGASASIVTLGLLGAGVAAWLFMAVGEAMAQRTAAADLREFRERRREVAGRLAEETDLRLDTPVSLRMQHGALRDVLQRIGAGTKLQIVYPLELGLLPTEVDAQQLPARIALDQVLDQHGLVWMQRGDLAIQVLPLDGRIPSSHKLLRAVAATAADLEPGGARGAETLELLAIDLAVERHPAISGQSLSRALDVLQGIGSLMPSRVAASRAIVQVERDPATESDSALFVEVTAYAYRADDPAQWAASVSNSTALAPLLANPPRLLLDRPAPAGQWRQFSILLSLSPK